MHMKILIDARSIRTNNIRGIGYTVKNIALALSKIDSQNDYVLLVKKPAPDLALGNNFSFWECDPGFDLKGIISTADFGSIPRAITQDIKPDVIWSPANDAIFNVPRDIPSITTIQDLIFFQHKYNPLTKSWIGAQIRKARCRHAVRRSVMIHTSTHHNKERISQFFGLNPDRIFVSYYGINIAEEVSNEILTELSIAGKKFIYSITATSPHKNLPNLLRAFQIFRQNGYAEYGLVLTGILPSQVEGVRQQYDCENVIFTKTVSNAEKNTLMQNAALFVLISKFEGFGMPPAEAVYNGAKLLLSDILTLRELYHECAHFTPPHDPEKIAESIQVALQQPIEYEREVVLRKFDWAATATSFLRQFSEVVNQPNTEVQ